MPAATSFLTSPATGMSKKRLGKVDTPISASQTFTKVRPENELNLEDESEDETGTPLLLARTFTGVPPSAMCMSIVPTSKLASTN